MMCIFSLLQAAASGKPQKAAAADDEDKDMDPTVCDCGSSSLLLNCMLSLGKTQITVELHAFAWENSDSLFLAAAIS
jgi:hypothetical protein